MMKRNINKNELGSIGIGAMIVFIALILVAAVASAVIIQTGEKLQQNAQRTGEDTSDELSGKITIQSGYIQNGGEYVLYVRLGAGSDTIQTVDISYQLYCNANAGYEFSPLDNTMVQLQSDANFAGGEDELLVKDPYKIMITPAECTAADVSAADGRIALYLHVEDGGTTYEMLQFNVDDDGTPII